MFEPGDISAVYDDFGRDIDEPRTYTWTVAGQEASGPLDTWVIAQMDPTNHPVSLPRYHGQDVTLSILTVDVNPTTSTRMYSAQTDAALDLNEHVNWTVPREQ